MPRAVTDHDRPGISPRYATVVHPPNLEAMRRFFRGMNRGMVMLWRLGLGPLMNIWPAGFGRILVIEHIGRRSGTQYRTPVNYTTVGDDLYCLAAFGTRTDWYRNAMASPNITVWVPSGRRMAVFSDDSDDPARLDVVRRVLIDSGFAAPLVGLHPRRMTDEQLAEATVEYRLVRIRPGSAAAPPSPADLRWIWPVAAGLMLALRRWRHTLRS